MFLGSFLFCAIPAFLHWYNEQRVPTGIARKAKKGEGEWDERSLCFPRSQSFRGIKVTFRLSPFYACRKKGDLYASKYGREMHFALRIIDRIVNFALPPEEAQQSPKKILLVRIVLQVSSVWDYATLYHVFFHILEMPH